MTTLNTTWQLVTPAFVGTAQHEVWAALRPSAILGQLRRWWWARAVLDCQFYDGNRLSGFNVTKAERFANELFGAPGDDKPISADRNVADGKRSGQGVFLVSATSIPSSQKTQFDGRLVYLLGQIAKQRGLPKGRWEEAANKNPMLAHVPAGQSITLSFTLRKGRQQHSSSPAQLVCSLAESLATVGLLGGVGAASRRGFGSLSLTELSCHSPPTDLPEDWTWPKVPENVREYKDQLIRLFPCRGATLAPPNSFAAFADTGPAGAVYFRADPDGRPDEVFMRFAQAVVDFAAEKFGPKNRLKAAELFSTQSQLHDRRPSLAHFHLHKLPDATALVCSLLPALEMPPGLTEAEQSRKREHFSKVTAERHAWILEFLGRMGMDRVAPPTPDQVAS